MAASTSDFSAVNISMNDSSSSDTDEEILMMYLVNQKRKGRKRKFWVHPLHTMQPIKGTFAAVKELVNDPVKFQSFYRMHLQTFQKLVSLVGNEIRKKDTNFRLSVPVEERLLLTLRFLATGTSFRAMSYNFLRGETTIRKIIYETCDVIWKTLQPIYMAAPTDKDWSEIAEEFKNKWQMPNCIGSIDGKHIRIKQPNNSGSAFINYNSYFSIVLLAVADAECMFTIISIGDYGRNSDGGVLRNSSFGTLLQRGQLNIPPPSPLPGEDAPFPHLLQMKHFLSRII